jgi:hypothetical protein
MKLASLMLLALTIQPASAFSPPPSWDPMLMLNVTLDASNRLAVETTPYIIRLTIAPGAYNSTNQTYDLNFVTFDPAQPCAVLNATAYSRVLGWYDEGTTGFGGDDFYASYAAQLHGTNYVWIERIGGSPELKTYFINEDVTGDPGTPYTPIFGTDGSSPKWRWDGRMDHNAYSVDLRCLNRSNQLFTATYYLYVGDAIGNTNAAFTPTITTWRWQGPVVPVVPSAQIALTNGEALIRWPARVTNLVLLTADTPTAAAWSTVTNAPSSSNGLSTVQLTPTNAQQFFRLQLTP